MYKNNVTVVIIHNLKIISIPVYRWRLLIILLSINSMYQLYVIITIIYTIVNWKIGLHDRTDKAYCTDLYTI